MRVRETFRTCPGFSGTELMGFTSIHLLHGTKVSPILATWTPRVNPPDGLGHRVYVALHVCAGNQDCASASSCSALRSCRTYHPRIKLVQPKISKPTRPPTSVPLIRMY